jgi:hypothetical protein
MSKKKKSRFKQGLNSFKHRLNSFKNWLTFRKKMIQLWWADAPRYQKDLEKGNFYIRRGALYQVGQPFVITDPRSGKKRKRYIANLYFNFKANKITHSFSDKPIKGFTEQFES